jgi:hypothetical protein
MTADATGLGRAWLGQSFGVEIGPLGFRATSLQAVSIRTWRSRIRPC